MDKQMEECVARRSRAAAELGSVEVDLDAHHVTESLVDGLKSTSGLMFERIHNDVEAYVGRDSMLVPVSIEDSSRRARREIESYQLAISAVTARDRNYISSEMDWYLRWLAQLRLGRRVEQSRWLRQVNTYLDQTEDEQRLEFSRRLESVFPEARHAPLILYRLFPIAVRIVTAVAFGANLEAAELRNRQAFWLPAISDCHECHGRPLDNGEQCDVCGNPIWTFNWLTAE